AGRLRNRDRKPLRGGRFWSGARSYWRPFGRDRSSQLPLGNHIRDNQNMLRQKWGSVVCPSCRNLVGVNDERCFNCGRWNPGLWGYAPALNRLGRDLGFVPLVLTSCMVLYTFSLVADVQGIRASAGMDFLQPSTESLFLFGASGWVPVFYYHHWWTVLTASWLHGGFLHILFNMMWLRQLAPETAETYGASRMVIIYTISGMVGFTMSSFGGFVTGPNITV